MRRKFDPPERFFRIWLLVLGVLVYAIILVGGATRLTDSGLSITEWAPISGMVPPLSPEAWNAEFALYQQTTEYQNINKGMSLAEFKFIYWWEWGHRQMGRIIGLITLIGLGILALVLRARKKLILSATALTGLIVLQGTIGWWMVASGIGETKRVDVAPYRLAVHFSMALVILCLIVWNYWSTPRRNTVFEHIAIYRCIWPISLLFALVLFQMASGALVAGLDAGRSYTDWPLMDGVFLPEQYGNEDIGWRSYFEGRATVQFNHRMLAYILYGLAALLAISYRRTIGWLCFGILTLQVLWGIYTLISGAPMLQALIHQGLGVVAMMVCLYWVRFSSWHKALK